MTVVAQELDTAASAGKCRCEVRGAANCTAGRQRVRELPPGGPGLRPLIINTDVSQNRNASGGAKHGIGATVEDRQFPGETGVVYRVQVPRAARAIIQLSAT